MYKGSNINDYIRWRGDLRIGVFYPFNDVDAMILARVSYLPFTKIKMGPHETLGSAADKMIDELKESDFAWPDDLVLVKNLKTSKRFKDMFVTDYVRKNSTELECQFSAVTIHINYHEMYLSFFGTDDTLVGWKEDFNLAFLDKIPAQKEGEEYLKRVCRKFPMKSIRLGGHSKGGNIAMYVGITAPDAWQYKMKKIYNFDGPGLRKGTAALDLGTEKVIKKITSFIPQDSVIGRLLEHNEKVVVVKSDAKNLMQHDIYSWEVQRNGVVESETTDASDFADQTITTWIESASNEERKTFINSLFKVFETAKVNTPLELKAHFLKFAPTMIKAYRNLPKEKRATVMAVWKKLASSFVKTRKDFKEEEKEAVENSEKEEEKRFKIANKK